MSLLELAESFDGTQKGVDKYILSIPFIVLLGLIIVQIP